MDVVITYDDFKERESEADVWDFTLWADRLLMDFFSGSAISDALLLSKVNAQLETAISSIVCQYSDSRLEVSTTDEAYQGYVKYKLGTLLPEGIVSSSDVPLVSATKDIAVTFSEHKYNYSNILAPVFMLKVSSGRNLEACLNGKIILVKEVRITGLHNQQMGSSQAYSQETEVVVIFDWLDLGAIVDHSTESVISNVNNLLAAVSAIDLSELNLLTSKTSTALDEAEMRYNESFKNKIQEINNALDALPDYSDVSVLSQECKHHLATLSTAIDDVLIKNDELLLKDSTKVDKISSLNTAMSSLGAIISIAKMIRRRHV